ncbi:MAG: hypothetical protein JXQ72_16305 [Anaerolineae bacterium]|nr:hypothetical protein [Anaerolineae bacterium]
MADDPQANGTGDLDQVQAYRRLVLEYEALDEEIDELLAKHQSGTDHMSAEELDRYRTLARRRDDVYNRVKALEHQILDDDAS